MITGGWPFGVHPATPARSRSPVGVLEHRIGSVTWIGMSRRLAGAFLQYGSSHWGLTCGVWLRTLVRQDAAASRSCVCEDTTPRRPLRGPDRAGAGRPKPFALLAFPEPRS